MFLVTFNLNIIVIQIIWETVVLLRFIYIITWKKHECSVTVISYNITIAISKNYRHLYVILIISFLKTFHWRKPRESERKILLLMTNNFKNDVENSFSTESYQYRFGANSWYNFDSIDLYPACQRCIQSLIKLLRWSANTSACLISFFKFHIISCLSHLRIWSQGFHLLFC